ncbi:MULTISPECIES: ABC transporter permease [Microtetraspora]|uniref:ABC transporter permease n=1 Tax=Microtetraspora glauca TaxID=1996 RepID=A0ABV3GDB4_MICGL|nr:ABC transporter permease [Microtetraspora sp. AC03309]MCC5575025.1 ABC transporter permease [Microtetraspora sp. AC03309]
MNVVKALGRLWLVPVALVAWEVVTRVAEQPFFPPPSAILARMYELWFSGPPSHLLLTDGALADLGPSLARLFTGWLVTAVIGIAAGIAIGCSPRLSDYVDPLIQFGRAVPPPLLVPFFLALLKLGTPAQLATIVFGVIWPILLNTIDGARTVDRQHLETARIFGFSAAQRLWQVILPSAMPKIFAGLRLALSLALILMVIAEIFAGTDGIGYRLLYTQRSYLYPDMWGCIVLLGLLGYLLNSAFLLVERRVLAWHRGARQTT